MDTLIERCAGIDIGKDEVVACVRTPGPGGRGRVKTTRTFTSFTASLEAMADWLAAEGVTEIAMEATGSYWKPVWYVLEERAFGLKLVNAHHVKILPGRKSDVLDAEWLAELLEQRRGVVVAAVDRRPHRFEIGAVLLDVAGALLGEVDDPAAVGLHGERQAGAGGDTVEADRAGTADAVLTADLGAMGAELMTQEVAQEHPGAGMAHPGPAVQRDGNRVFGLRVQAWHDRASSMTRRPTRRTRSRR